MIPTFTSIVITIVFVLSSISLSLSLCYYSRYFKNQINILIIRWCIQFINQIFKISKINCPIRDNPIKYEITLFIKIRNIKILYHILFNSIVKKKKTRSKYNIIGILADNFSPSCPSRFSLRCTKWNILGCSLPRTLRPSIRGILPRGESWFDRAEFISRNRNCASVLVEYHRGPVRKWNVKRSMITERIYGQL